MNGFESIYELVTKQTHLVLHVSFLMSGLKAGKEVITYFFATRPFFGTLLQFSKSHNDMNKHWYMSSSIPLTGWPSFPTPSQIWISLPTLISEPHQKELRIDFYVIALIWPFYWKGWEDEAMNTQWATWIFQYFAVQLYCLWTRLNFLNICFVRTFFGTLYILVDASCISYLLA